MIIKWNSKEVEISNLSMIAGLASVVTLAIMYKGVRQIIEKDYAGLFLTAVVLGISLAVAVTALSENRERENITGYSIVRYKDKGLSCYKLMEDYGVFNNRIKLSTEVRKESYLLELYVKGYDDERILCRLKEVNKDHILLIVLEADNFGQILKCEPKDIELIN